MKKPLNFEKTERVVRGTPYRIFSLPSDTVTHMGHPLEEICGYNKINETADKKALPSGDLVGC